MKILIGIATAATLVVGGASVASAQDLQAFIDADAGAGEAAFRQCSSCHMVGPNARARVGPPLNGIVGRDWGSIEGFRYSDSHLEAGEAQGGVWTASLLNEYLPNPRAMVARTRMAFAVRDASQLPGLIKYLASFDADGNSVDPVPVLEESFGG
ncbi:MAG: c-type cytochrome [Pseudomonadota bacterium]